MSAHSADASGVNDPVHPEMEFREDRLADLRMRAEHAQRRLDLYRARAYGMRSVSESRMRQLEREAQSTQERLRAALRAADRP